MPEKRERSDRGGGDDQEGRRGDRSKKPKDNCGDEDKIGDDSGQTIKERQQLREQLRQVLNDAVEQRDDIADLHKDTMANFIERMAGLVERVKYTRELSIDGETFKIIAKCAVDQVKQVSLGNGVDITKFATHLVRQFSSSHDDGAETDSFNWVGFGSKCAAVFLSVPQGGGFMLGPLDKPAKGQRMYNKRGKKAADDDAEEEVMQPLRAPKLSSKTKPKKDQTEKRIHSMREQERKPEKLGKEQDLVECLFNPNSFTQTVENIFDFSFFVKSGEGSLSVSKETGLPAVSFDGTPRGDEELPSPRQWLMTITPSEFRELVELYKLEKSNIPHRDEGKNSTYFDPLVDGFRKVDQ